RFPPGSALTGASNRRARSGSVETGGTSFGPITDDVSQRAIKACKSEISIGCIGWITKVKTLATCSCIRGYDCRHVHPASRLGNSSLKRSIGYVVVRCIGCTCRLKLPIIIEQIAAYAIAAINGLHQISVVII